MEQTQSLRQAIDNGQTVWAAGVYDALSAKIAQAAGFSAVMTSGFAVSASYLGLPDVELYTMSENLNVIHNVANAVTIAVIADADTGYGNAINVMRTTREFEKAGAAAMIFEDQEAPKRCPAVADAVAILPKDEGVAKIRAAVQARQNPATLIIARTDAFNEEEAILRAQAYAEAGADLIQPISKCFKDIHGLRRLRQACGKPLSLQILGWLETDLSQDEIQSVAGLAVFPLVALMTMHKAMLENMRQLHQTHSTQQLPHAVTSMKDFKSFIGFDEITALQNRFLIAQQDFSALKK